MTSIALVSRCFDLRLSKKLMIGSTSLDNMKQNHKQLCRGRSRLPALYQELSHKYLLPVQPVGVVTLDSVTILNEKIAKQTSGPLSNIFRFVWNS